MSYELSIRKTHKYVGTCSHLDDWQDIGSCKVIGRENIELPDDADTYCDPRIERLTVRVDVEPGTAEKAIERALHDVFNSHGCHHDYDCCGCRSYSTFGETRDEIDHLGGPIWQVIVYSSCNY